MLEKGFEPKDIAEQAIERLRSLADPPRAEEVQRYFKNTVKVYGLRAPLIRAIAAEYYRSIKATWTAKEAIELCDILFPAAELETKAIAGLILSRFKKEFPRTLFTKTKGWLSRNYLDNWASVDLFCTDAMGALLVKYPDLVEKIKGWAFHPNRWVKRASAVSFIKLAKRDEYHPVIFTISKTLFPAKDDLVQKANGWLLRETGKRDMRRLEVFLLEHGPAIPRTTLRYAIERYPEKKRRTLLQKTR